MEWFQKIAVTWLGEAATSASAEALRFALASAPAFVVKPAYNYICRKAIVWTVAPDWLDEVPAVDFLELPDGMLSVDPVVYPSLPAIRAVRAAPASWRRWLVTWVVDHPVATMTILAVPAAAWYARVFLLRSPVWPSSSRFVRLRSWLNDRFVTRDAGVLRPRFRDLNLPDWKPMNNHTHGVAAANRGAATRAIYDWIASNSMVPYNVSSSGRDEGLSSHHHYMEKDLRYPSRQDRVPDNACFVLIDVDYYADMHSILSHWKPVLLYTFTPVKAAGADSEATYWFNGNGTVHHVTPGGHAYDHELWDFSSDTVCVDVGFRTYVFTVDRIRANATRTIVALLPMAMLPWPLGVLQPASVLKRRKAVFGEVVVTSWIKDGALWYSFGTPGQSGSAEVSAADLAVILVRYQAAKKPVIYDVASYLTKTGTDAPEANRIAALVWPFLTSKTKMPEAEPFLGAAPGRAPPPVNYIAAAGPIVSDDWKETGRELLPSLVDHPDMSPAACFDNDVAAVQGRIYAVLNDTKLDPPTKRMAEDFVRRVVPVEGVGTPWSVDQVDAVQSRPLQRGRTDRAVPWMAMEPSLVTKAMMKREVSGGYPRNISTCPTDHTLDLSRYTYAFKDGYLKTQPWYAPGMHPETIANRVVEICSRSARVVETDFSNFDGTISISLRVAIERAVYLRYFGASERENLARLIDNELAASGVTATGYAYDPTGSRLSGSPLTTDGNTLINLFADYLAHRLEGRSDARAWQLVCEGSIKCGDDGLSTAGPTATVEAAKRIGLRVKCEVRTAASGEHSDALTFLSRAFRNPWSGDPGSMQAPLRALRKLQISFADATVSDAQALVNRAFGYMQLDPEASPLVYAICQVMKHAGELQDPFVQAVPTPKDMPFFIYAQHVDPIADQVVAWPQADGEWGMAYTAWQCQTTVDELYEFAERLGEMHDDTEWPSMCRQWQRLAGTLRVPPPTPKIPVVVPADAWALLPVWAKPFCPEPVTRTDMVAAAAQAEEACPTARDMPAPPHALYAREWRRPPPGPRQQQPQRQQRPSGQRQPPQQQQRPRPVARMPPALPARARPPAPQPPAEARPRRPAPPPPAAP